MRRRLLLFVLSALLLGSNAFATQQAGDSSDAHASSSKANSAKTVHVRSYTRKDGTVVRGYDRVAPGAKDTKTTAPVRTAAPIQRDERGRIKRSAAAKDEFERETGYPHGRPGYVVDHIKPLACGGADAPSNMQWQTIEEGKAKDKTERIGCK